MTEADGADEELDEHEDEDEPREQAASAPPKRRRGGARNAVRITLALVRTLRPHASGNRGALALASVLGVLFLVFRMAQPWPLKWAIDGLVGHKHHDAMSPSTIALLSLAYLVFAIGGGMAEYGQQRVAAGLANRIIFRFRGQLFAHVLGLPLAYQERRGSGELLTRLIWDTSRLRRGVSGVLLRMYQSMLLFVSTVAVLAWVSLPLAGVVLVFGAMALALMLGRNHKILDAARGARKREGRLASIVEENLAGARDLQTYRAASDRRFEDANTKSLKGEQRLARLEASLMVQVEVLLALAVCLILWIGSRAVHAKHLTAGDLVLFVHYTLSLYRPFIQFARQSSQAGRTLACAERLVRLAERRQSTRGGELAAPPFNGEIVFDDVRVKAVQRARGGRTWLLDGLSFRIAPGEHVAIMGLNGAGKSTLLRQILGLQRRDSGAVLIDSVDVREYGPEYRDQFSVVHQGSMLLGLTVRENVALGKLGATDDEILAAIERAGAGEFVRSLPKGLDTIVRGARIFSAGERQRLILARAILRGGRVWLLDEPTTALDHPQELERILREESRGKTMIWIMHEQAAAMNMDRVLVLVDGRLGFEGTPDELRSYLARSEAPTDGVTG